MPRIATEDVALAIMRRRQSRQPSRVRFFALDGAMRVVIEADSEDDARYLCRDQRWDFICLCDD